MKKMLAPGGVAQTGFALIESLIVVSVLGVGFLSANKIQTNLVKGKMLANQQSEAMIMGTEKMEELRNFTDLTAYDGMSNNNDTVSGRNTNYTRTWTIGNQAKYKQVDLTISWTTAENQTKSMMLSSVINATDPQQSGNVFNTSINTSPLPSPGSTQHVETDLQEVTDSIPITESTPTRDETIPGTNTVLTYDEQTNDVLKINGEDAISLSGSVSLATGSNAPDNSVSLAAVTVSAQTNNSSSAHCSYSTDTYNYSCIVGISWEGNINLGGVSGVKVCVNSTQPYAGLSSSLTNQNFVLNKSSRNCSSDAANLHQTL